MTDKYLNLKNVLRLKVQDRMDYGKDLTDAEVDDMIDDCMLEEKEFCFLPLDQKKRMKKELFDAIRRLDILQIFVEDPDVTEIMINGLDRIFIEKAGNIQQLDIAFESREQLESVIQQIVAGCNRVVNEASPIVDARLMDGSRVNVVMKPIALNGPIVTIRRFPKEAITMEQLLMWECITPEAAQFLEKLVKAGYNIFISGGTGSGKTTFLNVLSGFIPSGERVITIEDSAELMLQGIPNLVRLETRNSNVEGCVEVSIRDLIRSSLRMRPDRIIVGEVRGKEAGELINSFNSGHDGSMSTGHANSAKDMLHRLENMILMGVDMPLPAIRQQIASGIDILVHLGRLRDRSRRVLEILEVLEYKDGEIVTAPLFVFEETGQNVLGKVVGRLEKKGELFHEGKLLSAGLL